MIRRFHTPQAGLLLLALLTLVAFRLWMTGGQEFLARVKPHDDSLFLYLAAALTEGQWLGEFNNRTLIKGPGYPLFIALVHRLGIPLLWAQQLLYVGACGLAVVAIRPLCRSPVALLAGFVLLMFNPASFHDPVVVSAFRESFYLSLALALCACMVGLGLGDGRLSIRNLAWSLLLGVVAAWLWLTREESIWVLPGFVFLALVYLPTWSGQRGGGPVTRFILLLIPALIVYAAVSVVVQLNQHHYRVPHLVDIKSPEFVSALGGLMNIRPVEFTRTEVVSPASLASAMAVSPSLAELAPGITASQYPASFFIWTLRSAARKAGYYANPDDGRRSLDLYRRIGNEIAAACAGGELDCLDRGPSLRPPWLPHHWAFVGDSLAEVIGHAIGFSQFNVYALRYLSDAPPDYLDFAASITGEQPANRTHRALREHSAGYQASRERREYLMKRFVNVYRYLVPILFLAALFFHGRRLVRMSLARRLDRSALFALLPLGYVATLVLMLTYVLVTLWPVDRPLHTVYPLVLLYIMLVLCTRSDNQPLRDS